MSFLAVEAVRKRFGGVEALAGCSLDIEEGSVTGIIGPNGSGKTTLFNVISGFVPPDSGVVRLRDRAIHGLPPEQIYGLGLGRTFQQVRIFPRLSVLENVLVASARCSLARAMFQRTGGRERERSLALLHFLGIDGLRDAPAGSLSFGQKKLLEIATILVGEPRVILLDEPAGGVNPTMAAQLAGRIRALNRQGVTFLIVEHNMEFVMGLCDRIVVMARGRVIAEGRPEEVRANPEVLEAYLGS